MKKIVFPSVLGSGLIEFICPTVSRTASGSVFRHQSRFSRKAHKFQLPPRAEAKTKYFPSAVHEPQHASPSSQNWLQVASVGARFPQCVRVVCLRQKR